MAFWNIGQNWRKSTRDLTSHCNFEMLVRVAFIFQWHRGVLCNDYCSKLQRAKLVTQKKLMPTPRFRCHWKWMTPGPAFCDLQCDWDHSQNRSSSAWDPKTPNLNGAYAVTPHGIRIAIAPHSRAYRMQFFAVQLASINFKWFKLHRIRAIKVLAVFFVLELHRVGVHTNAIGFRQTNWILQAAIGVSLTFSWHLQKIARTQCNSYIMWETRRNRCVFCISMNQG